MSTLRVALWPGTGKFGTVEQGATKGATIGANVYNEDGTLFVPGDSVAAAGSWTSLVNIPLNVQSIAVLAGSGFVRFAGGEFSAYALDYGDLPTAGAVNGDALVLAGGTWAPGKVSAAVPTRIAADQTYTVAADTQALFALPIELDSGATLEVDGALVEVA